MSTLVLGTAGHIDHGKTALVRALTGVDTDRLPEEKQRGITIDLGFASLPIGEDAVAIVDVPGHEDFIRNMVAGATGLDAVLLIVAADEGVMPQTREHLAILDLLNVQAGVVAITKSDLVTEEWLELVCDDVRELLATTSLRDMPLVAVSSRTGAGIEELKRAVAEQAKRRNTRPADDLFRMPIDRVFTVRGTGTVITGTVWSGSAAVDDTIVVQPSGLRARIRGLEVHGIAVDRVPAGVRAAIALAGVDKGALTRGDVAVSSAAWLPANMLTLRARMIAGQSWSLEPRQRVRVHAGTAEVLARVAMLDADLLEPGQEGWVQLRLEAPLVVRVGDHVVMRSYSPVTTIGGGTVAEISSAKRSRLHPQDATDLECVISGSVTEAVNVVVAARGINGIVATELPVHTGRRPAELDAVLNTDSVVRIGERCFGADVVRETITLIVAAADRLHLENPLRPSLERSELRSALQRAAPELVDHALESAIRQGDLMGSGGQVRRTGFEPVLTERQTAACQRLVRTLTEAGLAAQTVSELAVGQGNEAETVLLLRLLEQDSVVRAVNPELFVEAGALAAAHQRMAGLAGQALSAADFRVALPVSRKHLIPLLEYFDRIGVTRREGDVRRVVARSGDG